MTMKQLHPGAKWHFRLIGFFGALFLAFAISIPLLGVTASQANRNASPLIFSNQIIFFVLVLALVLVILIEVYAKYSYKFFKYEFTENQLRVEKGIIWKVYSNIPYQRIQNVDITRGIIARLCGFSSVNIQTAGYSSAANTRGSHSEGYIPVVGFDEAEKIREFVVKKISGKKVIGL